MMQTHLRTVPEPSTLSLLLYGHGQIRRQKPHNNVNKAFTVNSH